MVNLAVVAGQLSTYAGGVDQQQDPACVVVAAAACRALRPRYPYLHRALSASPFSYCARRNLHLKSRRPWPSPGLVMHAQPRQGPPLRLVPSCDFGLALGVLEMAYEVVLPLLGLVCAA